MRSREASEHGADRSPRRATRRAFLARVAGIAAAPIAIAGCRSRRSSDEHQLPPPASESSSAAEAAAAARPPLPQAEPIVRVRVRQVGDHGTRQFVQVGPDGRWLEVGPQRDSTRAIVLRAPLDIRVDPSGWSILDSSGYRAAVDDLEPVAIAPAEAREQAITLDDRPYPGELAFVSRSDEAPESFDVVNHAPLEAYLPGVVAKELYGHWHEQAHMAQAVAARSFACCEHAWFAERRHFDLTDTQSSQAYAGLVTRGRAFDAARNTRGMVLAWESLLVPGYYSSCCGGIAASAIDVIGPNAINDIPPLHGRAGEDVCTGAPVHRWRIEVDRHLLTRRLIAYGIERRIRPLANFVLIASIEVIERNAHGRPRRYRLADTYGATVELEAEALRDAANHAGQGLAPPKEKLLSSNVRATVLEDRAVFEGAGFGHGAGLCQYGTEALARDGKSWREILAWYYPGAAVVRAYS